MMLRSASEPCNMAGVPLAAENDKEGARRPQAGALGSTLWLLSFDSSVACG